jgi:peptidoglycan/xylan/chitin deacetylase (PgdA/CDA1 family)
MRARIVITATVIALAAGVAAAWLDAAAAMPRSSRLALSGAVALGVEALLLVGVFERRAPIFGRVLWRGPAGSRAIALTFDDGPNEPFTSRVLDILRRLDVRATFFLIGENVERLPEAARRTAAEGHELANHGWDHRVLPLMGPRAILNEIERTNDAIERAAGVRPSFFRASHGWRNPWVNGAAKAAGCVCVSWTLGVWDTDRPGAPEIVRRTLAGLGAGCILLLHDGRGTEREADASQLVEALPAIVGAARGAGYRFLTISEMAKEAGRR